VTEQQKEWRALHDKLSASMAPGVPPPSRAEFFWALAAVRSRTFSGPYVASTLSDRVRLAGVVAFLVVGNTLAQGPDSLANSAGAAVAVFVFNILYEVILSTKLKQYAMCPVIDLANHSSAQTVRRRPRAAAGGRGAVRDACRHRGVRARVRAISPRERAASATPRRRPLLVNGPQAEASYDYFKDAFVVAAGRNYEPGSQVRPRPLRTPGAQSCRLAAPPRRRTRQRRRRPERPSPLLPSSP
jgi:hypothetical protein